jgi:DNA-binding Lrp family transcriptional regulator
MEKLDGIDKKILNIIQNDCSLHKKEIADKIGLSLTATYERIKRLERTGIIEAYVAKLNKGKVGKGLIAFCSISLKTHSKSLLEIFELKIKGLDDVMECFHTTGTSDYLLKIAVADMKAYQNLLINKLSSIENVSQVQSSFVMTEVKDKSVYVI